MKGKNVLVTGGAGFIGSHLVDRLVGSNQVTMIDDCSSGQLNWIPSEVTFVQENLVDQSVVSEIMSSEYDVVFHLAAEKAVNADHPRNQFESNTNMTLNVLEAMKNHEVDELVYTSSSTVYGEAPRPTPEDHAPLEPISVYGASKLADEGLCSAYAHTSGLSINVFRFANVVGPRLRGAVIPDFIEKLDNDPTRLEILGNGQQEKSYLHISDCLNGMLALIDKVNRPLNIFNLGTSTSTSVHRIADIVSDEMKCDPEYSFTGGDRGWTGDVPKMRLSIEKASTYGWSPKMTSDQAVRTATRELISEAQT